MKSPAFFVVLPCILLLQLGLVHSQATEVDPTDPIYKEKTGKSYEELLAAGEYIPIESLTNLTNQHSPPRGMEGRTGGLVIKPENVAFLLYTSIYKPGKKITKDAAAIKKAGWKADWGLKIVTHGFRGDRTKDAINKIKDGYLNSKTKNNVIAVDWGKYSGAGGSVWDLLAYNDVAQRTNPIGDIVGGFIQFLREKNLVKNLDKVHIVGHSLGAHIAGRVGSFLKKARPGETVGRITGLDPAGPSFYDSLLADRLDSGDAKFVDVIHTNMGDDLAGKETLLSLGIPSRCGHADFYPNGGKDQPACAWDLKSLGGLLGTCSHNKAYEYFATSIESSDEYKACSCGSWIKFKKGVCKTAFQCNVMMGEHLKPGTSGQFFLKTDSW